MGWYGRILFFDVLLLFLNYSETAFLSHILLRLFFNLWLELVRNLVLRLLVRDDTRAPDTACWWLLASSRCFVFVSSFRCFLDRLGKSINDT